MRALVSLFTATALSAGILLAGSGSGPAKRGATAKPVIPPEPPIVNTERFTPPVDGSLSMHPSTVGTLTTLRGYYDYQANGTPQHIRMNPTSGNIHVTYMVADDSAQFSNSRRVAYAMSTDGGVTWNNFSQVRLPSARRAGFPSIDLLRGSETGVLVANHNVANASFGNQSILYVDSPEGSGAFSEISAPPTGSFAADQPIWPMVAGTSGGSVVMHASQSTALLNWITTTSDFVSWLPWNGFSYSGSGGRNPTMATGNGLVGTLVNAGDPTTATSGDGGVWLYESTDDGATWGSPENVYPSLRVVGGDSMASWVAADFTYDGNNPLAAISESTIDLSTAAPHGYFYDSARVAFWSRATGVVTAVYHDTSLFVPEMNGLNQSNHLTVGGCTIAKSGERIVIVFEGFQKDTAVSGFRFCDLWMVQSGNGGVTWTYPVNITNTPNIDERFPSLSKYNQPGYVNLTWQEETEPGSYAIASPDNNLPSVNWQKFLKYQLPPILGVKEESGVPSGFTLAQNYPNPFNPATKIKYTVGKVGMVTLKVYNTLGQEVAALWNREMQPGSYEVDFDGHGLASGVYLYKMTAPGFSETKKMMLVK